MTHDGESTDEALMQAYVQGDLSSFERLFQRHRRPLFTYLLHHVGTRAVAEDLFQDVFLRLIRARDRYRPAGKFRAWLFTITHNVMTDHRRRAGFRAERSEAEMMQDDSQSSIWADSQRARDAAPDPVAISHANELRASIEEALEQIPDDQREVFLLRERGGLDFTSTGQRVVGRLPHLWPGSG